MFKSQTQNTQNSVQRYCFFSTYAIPISNDFARKTEKLPFRKPKPYTLCV